MGFHRVIYVASWSLCFGVRSRFLMMRGTVLHAGLACSMLLSVRVSALRLGFTPVCTPSATPPLVWSQLFPSPQLIDLCIGQSTIDDLLAVDKRLETARVFAFLSLFQQSTHTLVSISDFAYHLASPEEICPADVEAVNVRWYDGEEEEDAV